MPIRQLSPSLINRIAAGEVIERPASVVKELVENAIDADAHSIEIVTANGGLGLIRVTDDGTGMGADDIALCVERHATSKLQGEDLLRIASLGFRGEALPSIGSVAKLRIASRPRQSGQGLEVEVNGGQKRGPAPAALNGGTIVEVRDLFYATPARLKFMKSEQAENAATSQFVKRIALAFPQITLSLTTGERASLTFPAVMAGDEEALRLRLSKVMGKEFAVDENGVVLTGDQIMAICARDLKIKGNLKHNKVVSTVMSNMGFHIAMKDLGIELFATQVGDRYVMQEMMARDAVLGGEDSGHMIFRDCHTTGDGIMAALRLMDAIQSADLPLSELSKVMAVFPQVLINVDVTSKPDLNTVPEIGSSIKAAQERLGDQGRVLVRYSGTQLKCRVMVEGPTLELTDDLCRQIVGVVKESIG